MADLGSGIDEVNARIVYWGVEGAGKRTNLRVIRAKLRPDHRGELRLVPTRIDPTVSYAVLPIELGQVGGVRTRIQIVAVPGGPEHAVTRKQLLDQVDGIVFVVDTSRERIDENLASFEELRSSLAAYGRALPQVPLVIQYNKRDREDPFALEELHRKLSLQGVAAFEAAAAEGTAVLQTLTTISKRVIRHLRDQAGSGGGAAVRESGEPPSPTPSAEHEDGPEAPPAPAREAAAPEPSAGARDRDRDIAETAAAAQALFEPTFAGAATLVASQPEPPREPEPLRIESVGRIAQAGPSGLRVPLVLRDGDGRRVSLTLSLDLSLRPEEVDD
jgi:signal recognition particle receptor subunit beta